MHWFSEKRTYRLALLVVVPVVGAYFIYLVRGILLPFLLAFLVAYLLKPMVNFLERRGLTRLLAICAVYLLMAALAAGVAFYGFPKLISELNQLGETIPEYTRRIKEINNTVQLQYDRFTLPDSVRLVVDQRIAEGEKGILRMVDKAAGSLLGLFSHLFSFLLAPVLGFYILKDAEGIRKKFEGSIPTRYRADVLALVRDVDQVVRSFIRGHLMVSFIVGVLTWLGMALIGMPFALVIGIIAGVADLVPFFGPLIGAVPAVAIGSLQSWQLAGYALLVILVVQQLEGNVISPKILGDSLGLHPLMIIFVLLAGGHLYGVVGMLVAVPLAASIRVIGRYVFLKLVG
ncbi:MAG: AI-2E family transporter [Clostridia bacterium]|nr:AI-2E family transporter [Clostridia bacterium]